MHALELSKLQEEALKTLKRGKIVLEDSYGMADMAAGTPIADDAIVRIYSMTSAPPSYPTPRSFGGPVLTLWSALTPRGGPCAA